MVVSPELDPPVIDETLRPASSSTAVIAARLTTNRATVTSTIRFHGSWDSRFLHVTGAATRASSRSCCASASCSSAWSRWLSRTWVSSVRVARSTSAWATPTFSAALVCFFVSERLLVERPWANQALPTVTTRLPIAAPMIVPAAPRVESRTAEATAARAPAIARVQSIWTFSGASGSSFITDQYGRDPRRASGVAEQAGGSPAARRSNSGPGLRHTGPRDRRAADRRRPLRGAARLRLRAPLRRGGGRGTGPGADALPRRGPGGRSGRAAAARPADVVLPLPHRRTGAGRRGHPGDRARQHRVRSLGQAGGRDRLHVRAAHRVDPEPGHRARPARHHPGRAGLGWPDRLERPGRRAGPVRPG